MKGMLAVTVVLEVEDRDDGDAARERLLALVRADPQVVAASAPFATLTPGRA